MSRKETESEREMKAKWKKVSRTKEAYNASLLPTAAAKPDTQLPSAELVTRKTPGQQAR